MTVYEDDADRERMFERPRLLLKNGRVRDARREGHGAGRLGATHTVKPAFDAAIERRVARFFEDYRDMRVGNFVLRDEEIEEGGRGRVVAHPCSGTVPASHRLKAGTWARISAAPPHPAPRVAPLLRRAEELLVAHHRLARVVGEPVATSGVVVGDADHEPRGLAQAGPEAEQGRQVAAPQAGRAADLARGDGRGGQARRIQATP